MAKEMIMNALANSRSDSGQILTPRFLSCLRSNEFKSYCFFFQASTFSCSSRAFSLSGSIKNAQYDSYYMRHTKCNIAIKAKIHSYNL